MILITVESRIMAPQRYIHPKPWNLRICYCTGQRKNKVEDVFKVVNQLTLTKGGYSCYFGGSNVITKILKRGTGRQKRRSK